jgi:dihydroorotate dehydrogenase electron transfer subunit
VTAPFCRRLCEVAANRDSGGYRVVSLLDREGPEPQAGQFYMLAAAEGWSRRDGRPYLPRAISVAETVPAAGDGIRLDFLLDAVGPGTEALCDLAEGAAVWIMGPLGNSFAPPREVAPEAAGAVLVGGGVGVAPLALLRCRFAERGVSHRVLLGFRDRTHSGGLDLFCGSSGAPCPEVRLATEDGHAGVQGRVTDLLLPILAGDDASSAVVYTCGPPAMLESVRQLCEAHDIPCQIADESPMACGFGACFGCAVPKPEGGYMRLCVDGPVLSAGGAVGGPAAEEASATGRGGGSPAATGPAAGAPSSTSSRQQDLTQVTRLWPSILAKLAEKAPALAATFDGARPVAFDEEGLAIGFAPDQPFNKRKAESPDRRQALIDAFEAVTGEGVAPRYVMLEQDDAAASAPPPDTPAPGSEAIDEDELLQRLKSEFDAEEVS